MLRNYNSIKEVDQEIARILTAVRPYINSDTPRRGRKPKSITASNNIVEIVSRFVTLQEQLANISNVIANINSLKHTDDEDLIEKSLKNARDLKNDIEKQIDSENENSEKRTLKNISPQVERLAKDISRIMGKQKGITPDIHYNDGLSGKDHIMSAFVVFPEPINNVIALSQLNKRFFINPSLPKVLSAGQFNLGHEIKSLPEALKHLSPNTNSKEIQIKERPDSIRIFTTQEEVNKLAQTMSKLIFKHLLREDPKSKAKVVFSIKKYKDGHLVDFKIRKDSKDLKMSSVFSDINKANLLDSLMEASSP